MMINYNTHNMIQTITEKNLSTIKNSNVFKYYKNIKLKLKLKWKKKN